MNPKYKSWSPNQTIVINMVKQYPIIYAKNQKMSNKRYKSLLQTAWLGAAHQFRLPHKLCKRHWTEIKSRYVKLKILINTGRVTEEIVRSYPHLYKYLNGTLSFLDPYISDITEEDISPTVNKKINKIFGFVDFSCDQHEEYVVPRDQIDLLRQQKEDDSHSIGNTNVDNARQDFMNISGNTVKHSPEQLKPNKNIPSNNNEETTWDRINLGLESELLIEDNIKMEDENEYDIFEVDSINNNINDIVDDNVEHILPDIDSNNMTLVDNTAENTQAVYEFAMNNTENNKSMVDSNVTGISDDDIQKFFFELGQVMSVEMSLEKQKISRIRINSLVKEIIDEEHLLHG